MSEEKKPCLICGKPFGPKRFPSGVVERLAIFQRRKFCSRQCSAKSYLKRGPR